MSNSQEIQNAILQTLAYADVFDYPLTASEIHRYLTQVPASTAEVENELCDMSASVTKIGEFYALPGRESLAEIRQRRAVVAARLWPKALFYGRMIAALPFVRMLAVTGSLSMNNTDDGRDIDYLLVTAPGFLWSCRALSLLVFRVAKLDGVTLCPNYLVTENALEFQDRSLYTAHEVTQMIPLSGMDVYVRMRQFNTWTDEFLPNAQGAPIDLHPLRTPTWLQRVLEFILRLLPVRAFERWEMRRKIARFTQQAGYGAETHFSADVCQGNFDHHGSRTNTEFEKRLRSTLFPPPLGEGESQ